MKENIPKIIHYCWFGNNKKSKLIKKCIKSWNKLCPEYKFIEWNEKNFDVNCNKYVKEAYENKKWAFVSDYVRLYAVYNYGGIYLDTDIQLINNFDSILKYNVFFATENDNIVNTGLGFGAIKNNEIIKQILKSYDNISFINPENKLMDLTPCTDRNTKTLEKILGDINKLINKENEDNVIILSKDYFCPFDYQTGKMTKTINTIGIHWFNASWREKKVNIREKILRPIKRILGVDRFNEIKRWILR